MRNSLTWILRGPDADCLFLQAARLATKILVESQLAQPNREQLYVGMSHCAMYCTQFKTEFIKANT